MSKTADKIKTLAKQAGENRLTEEQQKIQAKVDGDLAVIEKILSMVKDRLIYKQIQDYRTKYVVVTEKMVLEDYTSATARYGGTDIKKVNGSFYDVDHTVIHVNGHTYYHAEDLFRKYEWQIKKAGEKSDQERQIISDKDDAMKEMRNLEPVVKAILLNYQEHLEDSHD